MISYVAFNGENTIGQMDPTTLEVNYFPIPHEDSRIRRLDIASDGTIWYVNSSQGKSGTSIQKPPRYGMGFTQRSEITSLLHRSY